MLLCELNPRYAVFVARPLPLHSTLVFPEVVFDLVKISIRLSEREKKKKRIIVDVITNKEMAYL